MIVTVESYCEEVCDLFCLCQESGEKIVVDPFVTAAVDCDDSNIKQIAASFVGKSFDLGDCKSLETAGVLIFYPSIFVEVSHV